jgi:hypothetical protein
MRRRLSQAKDLHTNRRHPRRGNRKRGGVRNNRSGIAQSGTQY